MIVNDKGTFECVQCHTTKPYHFYTYEHISTKQPITYCRQCIQLGRMDTCHEVYITATHHQKSEGNYQLDFPLTQQQTFASNNVIRAIQSKEDLLLYAVTGAGKTEMMFEGIQYARKHGYNVAVVSPRVDVVIEISTRIQSAFKEEHIDVLYQGQSQRYDGHFVIATVHQLYRFKQHFDVIFIDEVDAFPLSMDPLLLNTLKASASKQASRIFMTATPNKKLLAHFKPENIIILPARYHRKPLPVPRFHYFKLKPQKIQRYFLKLLQQQQANHRVTLVFFNDIKDMNQACDTYRPYFKDLVSVHSEDALRFEKVEDLRAGKHSIIFTTTILERGFTMPHLDVVVMNSHTFKTAALVQIAGRTGRKLQDTNGLVLFLHNGVTRSMQKAKRDIIKMNKEGVKRGWLDA